MNTAMRVMLVVVAVLMVGLAVAGGADAKGRRPVSSRVETQRKVCESGGGTMTAETYQTIAYTSCSGGTYDGYTCTLTPGGEDCAYKRVVPGGGGPLGGVIVGTMVEVSDDPVAGHGTTVGETAGVADEPAAEGVPVPGGHSVRSTAEGTPAATDAGVAPGDA